MAAMEDETFDSAVNEARQSGLHGDSWFEPGGLDIHIQVQGVDGVSLHVRQVGYTLKFMLQPLLTPLLPHVLASSQRVLSICVLLLLSADSEGAIAHQVQGHQHVLHCDL